MMARGVFPIAHEVVNGSELNMGPTPNTSYMPTIVGTSALTHRQGISATHWLIPAEMDDLERGYRPTRLRLPRCSFRNVSSRDS